MIEKIGWLGSLLLACCGIPELYLTVKNGTTGLSFIFLLMWGVGEIFLLIYTIYKSKKVALRPLLFNYGLNLGCIIGIFIFGYLL